MNYPHAPQVDANTYEYNEYVTIDATFKETRWYKCKHWNDETNDWFYVWSKDPLSGLKQRQK